MFKERNHSVGSLKGLLAAYLVLVLHVALVAVIGILILFFRGIANYAVLILSVSLLVTSAVILYAFKKIKRNMRAMTGMEHNLESRIHPLEINLLGGLASFKLGAPTSRFNNDMLSRGTLSQLTFCEPSEKYEVKELAILLEKELITVDQYNEAKKYFSCLKDPNNKF